MARGVGVNEATNTHLHSPLAWPPAFMTRNTVIGEAQSSPGEAQWAICWLQGRFGCAEWRGGRRSSKQKGSSNDNMTHSRNWLLLLGGSWSLPCNPLTICLLKTIMCSTVRAITTPRDRSNKGGIWGNPQPENEYFQLIIWPQVNSLGQKKKIFWRL